MNESYTMTSEEIEAAVYNWLASSGSHIINQFPKLEPLNIMHKGITIQFGEDPEENIPL